MYYYWRNLSFLEYSLLPLIVLLQGKSRSKVGAPTISVLFSGFTEIKRYLLHIWYMMVEHNITVDHIITMLFIYKYAPPSCAIYEVPTNKKNMVDWLLDLDYCNFFFFLKKRLKSFIKIIQHHEIATVFWFTVQYGFSVKDLIENREEFPFIF